MECKGCGTSLDYRDAFCSKCGALTERGKGPIEQIGRSLAMFGDELGKLFTQFVKFLADRRYRKQIAVGVGLAALATAMFTDNPLSKGVEGLFAAGPRGPSFKSDRSPNFADYEDIFLSDELEFRVTGIANVRDFPTSDGTQIEHTFSGGETVYAREVAAFDPTTRWYKLTSGGYLWAGNLAISTEQAASFPREFPSELQGEWSDNSACDGSQYPFWVEFSGDRYSRLGESGVVTGGTRMADGSLIFDLQMTDDRGAQYPGKFEVRFNAKRNGIRLHDLAREWASTEWWYRENVPCAERNEE